MPALLKPAPRSLAAQLWMLKHEGPEAKGLDDLQRLAGSGRTSIPVDKDTPKPLYRTIGYRVCGERAIRVDILERLADLIRPALAWREGVIGTRPPGAFNGFGFTVTGAMTSLTGASGEDFASILRSLGYRMEKRPKPAEPATSPTTPELTPSATTAEASAVAEEVTTHATEEVAEHAPTLAPDSEPVTDVVIEAEQPATPPEPAEAIESVAAAEPAVAVETAPVAPDAPVATDAPPVSASEPEMIEVWRPGRPQGEGRPRDAARRGRRHRDRPDAKPAEPATGDAPAVAAAAEAVTPGAAPEGGTPEQRGRPRHRRRRDGEEKQGEARAERPEQRERRDRPERSSGEHRGEPRGERRDRPGRPPRRDRDRDRRDTRDDNRPSRTWSSDQLSRGKDPDPNSPFAKLLALKEQLEANKERP
jgi:ATP-dependent RNA helicase SUPV3L1/SUV3